MVNTYRSTRFLGNFSALLTRHHETLKAWSQRCEKRLFSMPLRLPVCPSLRMEQIGSHGTDFMKFENWAFWDITRWVVVIFFTEFSKQLIGPICRDQNSKRKEILIFENFSKMPKKTQVSLQCDKNNGFLT